MEALWQFLVEWWWAISIVVYVVGVAIFVRITEEDKMPRWKRVLVFVFWPAVLVAALAYYQVWWRTRTFIAKVQCWRRFGLWYRRHIRRYEMKAFLMDKLCERAMQIKTAFVEVGKAECEHPKDLAKIARLRKTTGKQVRRFWKDVAIGHRLVILRRINPATGHKWTYRDFLPHDDAGAE